MHLCKGSNESQEYLTLVFIAESATKKTRVPAGQGGSVPFAKFLDDCEHPTQCKAFKHPYGPMEGISFPLKELLISPLMGYAEAGVQLHPHTPITQLKFVIHDIRGSQQPSMTLLMCEPDL